MGKYQASKQLVLQYFEALEKCPAAETGAVLQQFMSADYDWKCSYPFRELKGTASIANDFWTPLKKSLRHMQRRQDIFIAGTNEFADEQWVMSMGNFMGLFDEDWLGIRRTRKMNNLRYVEFSCVQNGKISKTGLFLDIIGFMHQAGVYPLPPQTGAYFAYPGPRYHNGLLFEDTAEEQAVSMRDLVNRMVHDLNSLNDTTDTAPLADCYGKTWNQDMIWYGPCGIGASYTIPRYIEQHQGPFTAQLKDKKFNGHVCRFAEGDFACFFGWPNLTNTPTGGLLGMAGGEVPADMQVVDVYCRRDGKLAENWVFIDLLYWLKQQGLDVLARTQQILN